MRLTKTLLLLILLLPMLSVSASWHEPYMGSRIFWDTATRKVVFNSGGYARLIQLQDGRLMATTESNGIQVAYSSDKGSSWSSPERIAANVNNVPECVPDLIQLHDGTIIVAYNPRPNKPYTSDRNFGIRCKRSIDNGKTWSDEIFVNDASYTFDNGCWEPSLLELPSGELHLYFADEGPYTSSGEQQISLCRSFDGGKTWGAAEKVAFRAGYRDGMPSAILLHDNATIALAFEDNGWTGVGNFIPTVAVCPLATDWHDYWVSGSSANRWQAVNYNFCTMAKGGAPYLRKLPWGETILSHQSDYGDGTNQMWVYVGNEQARDFKAMSAPFSLGDSDYALWNSLAVIDTGVVVAVGGISGRVEMEKGYAMHQLEAPYAKPVVDGHQTASDGYRRLNATQVILGKQINTRFTADFAYDKDSLYFTSRVSDVTQNAVHSSYCDGVTLLLDENYASETTPTDSVYRLFFRLDSVCAVYKGSTTRRRWVKYEADGVHYVVIPSKRYYVLEAAIPWTALGLESAPIGRKMRANVMLQDNRGGNTVLRELLPDSQLDGSWSWMDFVLQPLPSGIGVVSKSSECSLKIDGRRVSVVGAGVRKVCVYAADGRQVGSYTTSNFLAPFVHGTFIVKVTLSDGSTFCKKIIL